MSFAARHVDCWMGRGASGRVIARPFTGHSGAYVRTKRRKDFSVQPPGNTMLDVLQKAGLETMGIGKIEDIFAQRRAEPNRAYHGQRFGHSGNAPCNAATVPGACLYQLGRF